MSRRQRTSNIIILMQVWRVVVHTMRNVYFLINLYMQTWRVRVIGPTLIPRARACVCVHDWPLLEFE